MKETIQELAERENINLTGRGKVKEGEKRGKCTHRSRISDPNTEPRRKKKAATEKGVILQKKKPT